MDFESQIFEGKTFSDLLKNIYDNSSKKEKQIKDLISSLKPMVIDTQSALMVVPLIKEYLDVSVKNDDSLIKIAGIVQRAMANSSNGSDDFVLSESEREQLLNAVQTIDEKITKSTTIDVNKNYKD
jgi:altronate dehydratase